MSAAPILENLFTELKPQSVWLPWKAVPKDGGKISKVPYNTQGVKCNDRSQDVTYDELAAFLSKTNGDYSGAGIHIPPGYVCIDLDNCVSFNEKSEGAIAPWALKILEQLKYPLCELSPSKNGLHIWVKAKKPGKACRRDSVEMYCGDDGLRFMTLTGWHVEGTSTAIEERDISVIYEEMVSGTLTKFEPGVEKSSVSTENPASASSAQIESTGAAITNKYALFMSGTATGDKPTTIADEAGNSITYADRSAADLGFATVAGMKHGDNPDAIWADYLDSCIYRDEWGNREADFRRLTIANGIRSAARLKSAAPVSSPIVTELEDAESGLLLNYREEDAPEEEEEDPIPADDRPDDKWFFKGRLLNFPNAALFGVTGDIIRKLHPQTESHPAGNLLDLLISIGSIIGRGPHFVIESTQHHTNEFGVRVGKTSKARKGTGGNRIRDILKQVDSEWDLRCNAGGIGSGEMVVHRIRDDRITKNRKGEECFEHGVSDKRLHISEGEFASILVLQNKKDSSLSVKIRDGWDGKALRNETKGEGIEMCRKPHVSIMADTTAADIGALVSDKDKKNGWVNRFLFCAVERTKLLPHGGEDLDWTNEVNTLLNAVSLARKVERVFMTRNARCLWTRQYPKLTADVPGVLGAVTSRAEAHCLRIALILALLDESAYESYEEEHADADNPSRASTVTKYNCRIGREHLKAAFAFWSYCFDSARLIFGGDTDDQSKILEFISTGPKTLTDITQQLFHKNRRTAEVKLDMDRLEKRNKVVLVGESYTLPGAKNAS
jgi:hypothetical protein